ncbi:ankyrin [Auriscalpium vulgare]|uniref:Ankyrin n=1 Tax=Auriscalpium vulgare TaxID=40419 RepID=A0ACB8RD84_9AGAM|nr:ankyrin [Auriscalpium vulgare]
MSTAYDADLQVTPRTQTLLSIEGFLRTDNGGYELRDLYNAQTARFNLSKLDLFALVCYTGMVSEVSKAVRNGSAPRLDGTATPFEFGYATLVIAGSQRLAEGPPGSGYHVDTLKFLLAHGCPPDVPDICRCIALEHACMIPSTKPALISTLLAHGAAPNHQDIYGRTAMWGAMMCHSAKTVDMLMEYGADLAIRDADGRHFSEIYVTYGPETAAVVRKWLRARAGETAPRESKECAACSKTHGSLKQCARCHSVLYCSSECQRWHWQMHKPLCQAFSSDNTVTLTPIYSGAPVASIIAHKMTPPLRPPTEASAVTYPKSVIVKIQISAADSPFLIYTKKRDFLCYARREDDPAAYERVVAAMKAKGVSGPGGTWKGYFAAELKSADQLVVKVSELLADQPF